MNLRLQRSIGSTVCILFGLFAPPALYAQVPTGVVGGSSEPRATEPSEAAASPPALSADALAVATLAREAPTAAVLPQPRATPSATTAGAAANPPSPVYELRSIKATTDVVSGALAGNPILLEVGHPIDINADPKVELIPIDVESTARTDTNPQPQPIEMRVQGIRDRTIVATVPAEAAEGLYEVRVRLASGEQAWIKRPQRLKVKTVAWILGLAALPLMVIVALVWGLLHMHTPQERGSRRTVFSVLLLEPENNTYSLSRLQFLLWSVAITMAYVFIFVGRGLVDNLWTFPPLTGFGMTFLISLGTLLGAQATNTIKGAKGSGVFHPSPADLVAHGGVLALERMQQLLWTLIAVGMFLVIVFKSYATANQLPSIPEELWILMGVSSGGYLAGKVARNAGPIIELVRAEQGSTVLTVSGKCLSKGAVLWVDGKKLEDRPVVLSEDLEKPELASELQATLQQSDDEWKMQERSVVVVNPDGQRAEWISAPVIKSAILRAAGDETVIEVEGEFLGDDTQWELTGASKKTATVRRLVAPVPLWQISVQPTAETSGQVTAISKRARRRVSAPWKALPMAAASSPRSEAARPLEEGEGRVPPVR